MNGMPSAVVISLSRPATSICSCSDSTTQGPEIRNNGRFSPTSNPQSFIALNSVRRAASSRGGLLFGGAFTRRLVLQRRLQVTDEQRVAVPRRALELGVELHAHEPRMRRLRQLDDLGELLALRDGRHHQARGLQLVEVVLVGLVAVAVA